MIFFRISDGFLKVLSGLGILAVIFGCVIVAAIPSLLATIIIPHIQIALVIGIPLVLILCVSIAKLHMGPHYSAVAVETLALFLIAQSFFGLALFGFFPEIMHAGIFTIVIGLVLFFIEFVLTVSIALWCTFSLMDSVDSCGAFSRCLRYILTLSISMIHLWLWTWALKLSDVTANSIMEVYQVGPNHIMSIIAGFIESVPNFLGIHI